MILSFFRIFFRISRLEGFLYSVAPQGDRKTFVRMVDGAPDQKFGHCHATVPPQQMITNANSLKYYFS